MLRPHPTQPVVLPCPPAAELPDGVTLQDIIKTMPPEVFEINPWKSWSGVAIAVASFSFSLYLISICPAPLLPLAWAFSGTAFTGVRGRCSSAAWSGGSASTNGAKLWGGTVHQLI